MTPEEKLAALGLPLPPTLKPMGAYVPAVRSGNLVFVSGQLPMRDGELFVKGRVGAEVAVEEARECARQAALTSLRPSPPNSGGWRKCSA